LVVTVLGAAESAARAADEVPGADTKTAREHYKRGVAHYDLNEYAPALEEFKAAYRAVQDPSLLFNIAQCHRRLGQKGDALYFYRSYLRRSPEAPNRAEAERHIQELERELASVPSAPPPVAASPPAPVPAVVVPPAGAPTASYVQLPAPAPPPYWSNRRISAVVAGGVGLLAIGVGSAVALSARSSYDDVIDRCPGRVCTSLDDKNAIDDARARGNLATGIWIGGLAAMATGAVLWLTEPRRPSELTARPLLGPGLGGFAIGGALP
jgi:tetratricopeptide (TPR) repeat protein